MKLKHGERESQRARASKPVECIRGTESERTGGLGRHRVARKHPLPVPRVILHYTPTAQRTHAQTLTARTVVCIMWCGVCVTRGGYTRWGTVATFEEGADFRMGLSHIASARHYTDKPYI